MPDFSNDQIKGYADYTLGNGGSWSDITNAASQHGLTMDQVYGAGVKQPGVPDWLNSLNAGMAKDPTQTSWKDPTTGMTYTPTYSYSFDGNGGEGGNMTSTINGYAAGQYSPNGQYNLLDTHGNATGKTGQWGNPNADTAYLIAMAAMATGGALAAGAGGAGASTAGASTAGTGTFNAAADSQIANIGIQTSAPGFEAWTAANGANALAGYTAAGATPALVNGMATGADMLPGSIPPTGLEPNTMPGAPPGTPPPPGSPPGTPPGTPPGAPPPVTPPGGTSPSWLNALPPAVKALLPGGGTGLGLNDIINLLGGGIDTANQNKASNDMLDYLKQQQAKIDGMYAEGSPEKDYMQQTLDRKDAAAGRMSQYGPRSVDLAARIAQIKADETVKMTTGIGNLYRQSLNQKASAPTGLLSTLSNLANKTGYSTSDIAKWLSSNGWQPDTSTVSNADNYQPDGGDLGQYF